MTRARRERFQVDDDQERYSKVPWALHREPGVKSTHIALFSAGRMVAKDPDCDGWADRKTLMCFSGIGSPTTYYASRAWLTERGYWAVEPSAGHWPTVVKIRLEPHQDAAAEVPVPVRNRTGNPSEIEQETGPKSNRSADDSLGSRGKPPSGGSGGGGGTATPTEGQDLLATIEAALPKRHRADLRGRSKDNQQRRRNLVAALNELLTLVTPEAAMRVVLDGELDTAKFVAAALRWRAQQEVERLREDQAAAAARDEARASALRTDRDEAMLRYVADAVDEWASAEWDRLSDRARAVVMDAAESQVQAGDPARDAPPIAPDAPGYARAVKARALAIVGDGCPRDWALRVARDRAAAEDIRRAQDAESA